MRLAGLAAALVLCVCVALVCVLAQERSDGPEGLAPASSARRAESKVTGPRRVPVAGGEGWAVVIEPDGSSYAESPDGKRTPLSGPDHQPSGAVEAVAVKAAGVPRPRKEGLGRLVVCGKGVVEVAKGAVITFVGDDRVITHEPDGSSEVHFTDGRVVRRARPDRKVP